MALTFQDPLSKWGTGSTSRTNMIASSAGYIDIGASGSCETTQPRAGTHSFKVASGSSGNLRYALGGALGTWGSGAALWCTSLPASRTQLAYFYDAAGAVQFSLWCNPDGSIAFFLTSGQGTAIGSASAAGAIVAGAFVHIEVKAVMGQSTAGSVWARVGGIAAITATGIDNCQSANVECSSVEWFPTPTSAFGIRYLADPFAWDATGAYNADWIGNKVSIAVDLDADTATADWTLTGAASGYDCINDTAQDGNSTYIEAASINNTSEFEIAALPAWLNGIVAVSAMSTQVLDSSGSTKVQISLKSSASYATGSDRTIAYPNYTTYWDHYQIDPNGNIAFTNANVSAMKLRVKRTT